MTAPTARAARGAPGARHATPGGAGRATRSVDVVGAATALFALVCAVAVVVVPDGVVRAAGALVTVTFTTLAALGCDVALGAWRRVALRTSDAATSDTAGSDGRPPSVTARVAAVAGRPGRSPASWAEAVGRAASAPWPLLTPLLGGVLAPGAVLLGVVVAASLGWRVESVGSLVVGSAGDAAGQGPAAPLASVAGWLLLVVVAAAVAVVAAWALPAPSQRADVRPRRVLGVVTRRTTGGFAAVAGDDFTLGLRALVVGAVVVALAVGAVPDTVVDVLRAQPVAAALAAALLVFVAAPGVEAAAPVGLVLAPFGVAAVVAAVVVCLVLDRHGAAALARVAGARFAAWSTAVVVVPAVAVAAVAGTVLT